MGSVFHGFGPGDRDWGGRKITYEPAPLPAYKATELNKMPDALFQDLAERVEREKLARTARAALAKETLTAHINAFCNFLSGCAHAMACRAALRWAQGHKPFTHDGTGSGKTPTSGEMWTIYDVAKLGQSLLDTHGSIVTEESKHYSVNCNPMVWNSSSLYWLSRSQLPGWPGGSRFCCWKPTQ